MGDRIFKDNDARKRIESWYERFLERVDGKTTFTEVTTNFGKSHVLMAGNPENPPLVCLHAMMTSSAHLASELGPLMEYFYLILPDLPGQSVKGLPVRLPYSDDSHARWLGEVLDELRLSNVHMLGVSLGGFVARQFASIYPGRVSCLILIVPAGIVQGSLVKGFARMALPVIMYNIRPTEKRLRKMVSHLLTNWDEDWARYLGDSFQDFSKNLKIPPLVSDQELEGLEMPCLIIGAQDDISFPGEKLISRCKKHIPDIETELIGGSKHSPPTTPEFREWLGNRVHTFISG